MATESESESDSESDSDPMENMLLGLAEDVFSKDVLSAPAIPPSEQPDQPSILL